MGSMCSCHRKEKFATCEQLGSAGNWALEAQVSRRHFQRAGADRWGFYSSVNYMADAKSRFQPWATGGRHLTPVVTNADYFELGAFVPMIAQAHGKFIVVIEKWHNEVLSWKIVKFPRHVSFEGLDHPGTGLSRRLHIIGALDDLLVLQVSRGNGLFEGYILKDTSNCLEIVRNISFRCQHDDCCVMEATISPDYSRVLLKPSWVYIRQEQPYADNCIFLLDLTRKRDLTFTKLYVRRGMFTLMIFDPRYAWSRVAVGCIVPGPGPINDHITLVDLRQGRRVAIATKPEDRNPQRMVYSPDGRFLTALIGTIGRSKEFTIEPKMVCLYDSESLTLLKQFSNVGCGHQVPVMPFAIFPQFSADCCHLAIMYGNTRKSHVKIYRLPVELSLKSLCRRWLRARYSKTVLAELPLHEENINYLLLRHVYD